jgi:hypothetical protein
MKIMKLKTLIAVILVCSCVMAAQSPQFAPPPGKNAALRYWTAFAEMKDRSIDDATTKLMEDVLSGNAAWDEQRLGPIVEENSFAVRFMQRATELPECNWGLDYSLGSATPLAHLPRARVLARLNALYGARQMAKGDVEGAATTWLAGLRFAQHVGKDIGLIGALSARPAFTANLHLLTVAVASKAVNAELQRRIYAQAGKLPAEGLDWIESIRLEAWADEEGLKSLAAATDFPNTYKEFFGSTPPQGATPPSPADISGFRAMMVDVIAAFRLPPAQTRERIAAVNDRLKKANPAVQAISPNYLKLNDSREKVAQEKESLMKALK